MAIIIIIISQMSAEATYHLRFKLHVNLLHDVEAETPILWHLMWRVDSLEKPHNARKN